MGKKDLERNIKIINENTMALKDSNGFDVIEQATGIKKEKLLAEVEKNKADFKFEEKKLSY